MANPEREQDRVFDTFDHYRRFGFVMFPQNKHSYLSIAEYLEGSILEAGCGMGLGAYLISADLATDKLQKNVDFAKELYPFLDFDVWDITSNPWEEKYDNVVCIEAIEHVTDVERAIANLVASAKKHVWFTTPNNEEETPSNPFHVREYTLSEMLMFLRPYEHEVFTNDMTDVKSGQETPLIYHITV